MKLLYKGKTKDVYEIDANTVELRFKDDVTGEDGEFDPGANQVGLTIEGMGHQALAVSTYFFELFKEKDIPTHYLSSDLENNTMKVKVAHPFGEGLEVICRYKAVGSFIRRYGKYIEPGTDLDGYVEFTIKDDERQDPLITKDAMIILDILTEEQYDILVVMTKEICDLIKDDLAQKGLTLYDIKLEFGKLNSGEVVLIDEVSAGNMRVYHGNKSVKPLELGTYLTLFE